MTSTISNGSDTGYSETKLQFIQKLQIESTKLTSIRSKFNLMTEDTIQLNSIYSFQVYIRLLNSNSSNNTVQVLLQLISKVSETEDEDDEAFEIGYGNGEGNGLDLIGSLKLSIPNLNLINSVKDFTITTHLPQPILCGWNFNYKFESNEIISIDLELSKLFKRYSLPRVQIEPTLLFNNNKFNKESYNANDLILYFDDNNNSLINEEIINNIINDDKFIDKSKIIKWKDEDFLVTSLMLLQSINSDLENSCKFKLYYGDKAKSIYFNLSGDPLDICEERVRSRYDDDDDNSDEFGYAIGFVPNSLSKSTLSLLINTLKEQTLPHYYLTKSNPVTDWLDILISLIQNKLIPPSLSKLLFNLIELPNDQKLQLRLIKYMINNDGLGYTALGRLLRDQVKLSWGKVTFDEFLFWVKSKDKVKDLEIIWLLNNLNFNKDNNIEENKIGNFKEEINNNLVEYI